LLKLKLFRVVFTSTEMPVADELVVTTLLKLVDVLPPIDCSAAPLKVTVPELWVKLAPLLIQLPDTVKLPVGAVILPLPKVRFVTVRLPVLPVKLPPEMVSPPLKVCAAVLPW